MASKTFMFLLGTLLLVATKVSSYQKEDEEIMSSSALASAPAAPVKPPYKPPTYPTKPPTPAPCSEPGHPVNEEDCVQLCEQRCKSHKGKRECERSCSACCKKCKCVPPGTVGTNKEVCGKCYTEIRTPSHVYQCP